MLSTVIGARGAMITWLSMLALLLFSSSPANAVDAGVSEARKLCASGLYEEAIERYRDISDRVPRNAEAADITRLTELCMRELITAKDGRERLRVIAATSLSTSISALAFLVLATDQYWDKEDCSEALPLYQRIETQYPATDEAFRATIAKATNCLVPAGLDDEAIQVLKRVIRNAPRSTHRAGALYELGVLYRWREERRRARATFMTLMQDYSPDLEYPYSGGMKVVKSAHLEMRALDEYRLSPCLDRVMFKIRRVSGIDRSPTIIVSAWGNVGVEASVAFVARVISVLFVCSLLALSRWTRQHSSPAEPADDLFTGRWSLFRMILLLIVVAAAQSTVQIARVSARESHVLSTRVGRADEWAVVAHAYFTVGIMLVASSWKQSLRRIFNVGTKMLWRVAALVSCVAVTYVSVEWTLSRLAVVAAGSERLPLDRGNAAIFEAGVATRVGMTLAVAFLVPLAEEMVYRGLLFEVFRRRSNALIAAVLSSLLFALMHLEPVLNGMGAFIFGMIAVSLRSRFISLTPCTLFHILVNAPFALLRIAVL